MTSYTGILFITCVYNFYIETKYLCRIVSSCRQKAVPLRDFLRIGKDCLIKIVLNARTRQNYKD